MRCKACNKTIKALWLQPEGCPYSMWEELCQKCLNIVDSSKKHGKLCGPSAKRKPIAPMSEHELAYQDTDSRDYLLTFELDKMEHYD